jgi:probable RNA-binding protein EIF1AD
MSGVRRKTKYRKSVESDVLDSFPEPKDSEQVVRVVASRGGNLIEVETPDGARSLCRLPNRYRKVVWVKRGTILIVGSCTEDFETAGGEQGKVKFVVNHVVFTDDQIKNLRNIGQLPSSFDPKDTSKPVDVANDTEDSLHANRNRRPDLALSGSSSSDDDDEEEEEEDGDTAAAPRMDDVIEEEDDDDSD